MATTSRTPRLSPRAAPAPARRGASALALLALASLLRPGGAAAQDICPERVGRTGGVTVQAECLGPTVTITPTSQDTKNASLSVRVDWSPNGAGLDYSTRRITLRGTNVTSSFTHTSTYSTGTVSLVSGSNSVFAEICGTDGLCGSDQENYYRDTSAPSGTITPNGGVFSSVSVSVRIDWSDTRYLDGASRQITFDGVDVTDDFVYHSGTTSAYAEGTVWMTDPA